MKSKSKKTLSVSLYGMDGRTHKIMLMFLQGPCQNIAQVVDENEAEIDIIDIDSLTAEETLKHCMERVPIRPIIVLSLTASNIENTIFVKKPVNTPSMLAAFKEANSLLSKKKTTAGINRPVSAPPEKKLIQEEVASTPTPPAQKKQIINELATEKKVYVNTLEQKKTAKHKVATLINEKNFSKYIGIAADINFSNPNEWFKASYTPKHYYQGYVQSALRTAINKRQILKLTSGWKSLIILPHSSEVWLDADDKQLRFFAGVEVGSNTEMLSSMHLSPINPKKDVFTDDLDKFHDTDSFLWKLACWTSKGRYPSTIDLSSPVYLKQWPNFTRVVITPHAMRIAALLISGPRSMTDIIKILKIQPQYVFIFASAAYATGILGQAKRQSDVIVEREVPAVKSTKKKGLLNRILKKLRG